MRPPASRPGWGCRAQHRRQPARRAGHLLHQQRFRRARVQGRRAVSVAGDKLVDQAAADLAVKRRAPRRRRRLRRACAARRLHRSHLRCCRSGRRSSGRPRARTAARLFSGTMAGFQIPAALLAERLGAAAVLALGNAPADRLLPAGCARGSPADGGAVRGLGASPASARLQPDGAGVRRPRSKKALGTHLRRRHRQDDAAGRRLAAAGGDAWRPALALLGAPGWRRRWRSSCRRRVTAEIVPGASAEGRPAASAMAHGTASRSRCCSRSACSTARPAWGSCCSCRSCSPPRARACRPSGWR